jgi:hypothetical protein
VTPTFNTEQSTQHLIIYLSTAGAKPEQIKIIIAGEGRLIGISYGKL